MVLHLLQGHILLLIILFLVDLLFHRMQEDLRIWQVRWQVVHLARSATILDREDRAINHSNIKVAIDPEDVGVVVGVKIIFHHRRLADLMDLWA